MKKHLRIFLLMVLIGCQSARQEEEITSVNCDDYSLINYLYPIDHFINGRTLVYSFNSNNELGSGIRKELYELKIGDDSVLYKVILDSKGIVEDSTVYSLIKGVPTIIETFTRPSTSNELVEAKDSIFGNPYCELSTYWNSLEYKYRFEGSILSRKFQGYVTHMRYVKEVFNGQEYNCAIIESKKTLYSEFKGETAEIDGIWTACICENLGELYSTLKTDNGLIINNELKYVF